jgi:hypothetical protein
MPMPDNVMEGIINTSILISLVLVICFTTFHSSFSQTNITSPFSKIDSNIPSVSGHTLDGKYFINLQYAPTLVEKEEPIFFMVNLFENAGNKQIRMQHVDCDFIIQKDGIELFKMSTKYGEPFFHSINGVMLPTFKFTESGKYTISIEIAGIFFVPIKPVYANFSAMIIPTTEGKVEIKLSS